MSSHIYKEMPPVSVFHQLLWTKQSSAAIVCFFLRPCMGTPSTLWLGVFVWIWGALQSYFHTIIQCKLVCTCLNCFKESATFYIFSKFSLSFFFFFLFLFACSKLWLSISSLKEIKILSFLCSWPCSHSFCHQKFNLVPQSRR